MNRRFSAFGSFVWLVLSAALASCGGGEEEAAETETQPAAAAPTPPASAAPARPADDEGFPAEWRSTRQAARAAFEPCMAEIEAGAPGSACVRYSELVVIFRQAEALRLWECDHDEDAVEAACGDAPPDPVRQAEYDRAVNPGAAPVPDGEAVEDPALTEAPPEPPTPDEPGAAAEP